MTVSRRTLPVSAAWLRFFRGFLARPQQVASVMPSSRCLQRQLSTLPCVRVAQALVELGPGTGETTRALLSQMPKDARLLGIEIVPQFVEILREIPDPRLLVVHGSALEIDRVLERHRFPRPDVIVSGIPFSTMTRSDGRELVGKIHALLAPGGTFVTYQLRDRVLDLAESCFGPPQQAFVLWNLPPLRIFQWRKALTAPVARASETCRSRETLYEPVRNG